MLHWQHHIAFRWMIFHQSIGVLTTFSTFFKAKFWFRISCWGRARFTLMTWLGKKADICERDRKTILVQVDNWRQFCFPIAIRIIRTVSVQFSNKDSLDGGKKSCPFCASVEEMANISNWLLRNKEPPTKNASTNASTNAIFSKIFLR